jgi:hypothetical protein
MRLRDRIRVFMNRRNLTRREFANGLDMSPHTLTGWLDKSRTPPAAVAALIDVLESSSQARSRLGLSRGGKLPRGRSFERGNPWRLNDSRRPQALAESRKRRKAKD